MRFIPAAQGNSSLAAFKSRIKKSQVGKGGGEAFGAEPCDAEILNYVPFDTIGSSTYEFSASSSSSTVTCSGLVIPPAEHPARERHQHASKAKDVPITHATDRLRISRLASLDAFLMADAPRSAAPLLRSGIPPTRWGIQASSSTSASVKT